MFLLLVSVIHAEGQVVGVPGPEPVYKYDTLCGFEDRKEVDSCFSDVDWQAMEFVANVDFEGTCCARVTAGKNSSFIARFPNDRRLNLSKYHSLRVWVFNESTNIVRLSYSIRSANGVESPFTQTFVGPKSGRWLEATTERLKWRLLDVSQIDRVIIGASGRGSRNPEEATKLRFDAFQRVKRSYPERELRQSIYDNPGAYRAALLSGPGTLIEQTAEKLAWDGTTESARILFDGMANPSALYICTDALLGMDVDSLLPAVDAAMSSADRDTRMMACCVLRRAKNPEAKALLLRGLRDVDFYVRHFAAESLTFMDCSDCVEPLASALDDEYPMVRLNAAKALGTARNPIAIDVLCRKVADKAAGINAIRSLGIIADSAAVPPLCKALENPDLSFEAAEALARIGTTSARGRIKNSLVRIIDSGDTRGNAAAGLCLAAGLLKDGGCVTELETLSRSSTDEVVRYFAVQALGRLGEGQVSIKRAADDFCPLVRMAAARALAASSNTPPDIIAALVARGDASIAHALAGSQAVTQTATGEVAVAGTDEFDLDMTQMEGGEGTPTAAVIPPDEKDFVIFARRSCLPLRTSSVPLASDSMDTVSIAVAGDEYRAVQIGVRALRDLENATCEVTWNGKPLESSIHVMKIGEPPTVLEPGNKIPALASATTGGFWITLRVPPDAVPTEKTGRIRIEAGGAKRTIALKARILPFTLPRLDELMHILYTHELDGALAKDNDKVLRTAEVIYADLAAHGMNAASTSGGMPYTEKDGLPDTTMFELGLYMANRGGLYHPRGLFMVANMVSANKRKWTFPCTEFRDYIHPKRIQRLAYAMAVNGHKAGYYLADEPGLGDRNQDGPKRNQIATFLHTAAKEVPGAYTAMTGSEDDFEAPGRYTDLWVFGSPATIEQVESAMNMGKRVTNYGGMENAAGAGVAYRNKFGFFSWRSGELGQTLWTYPRNMCAEVTPDGTKPYTDWEAMRDGVNDLRYIRLLETLASADEVKRKAVMPFFRRLNSQLHPERDDQSWQNVDPEKLRAEVIEQIFTLLKPSDRWLASEE